MGGASRKDGMNVVKAIGYIPQDGVDLQEYQDYVGNKYRLQDIEYDLENGNMPPGLALKDEWGTITLVARNRKELRRFYLQ